MPFDPEIPLLKVQAKEITVGVHTGLAKSMYSTVYISYKLKQAKCSAISTGMQRCSYRMSSEKNQM